MTRRIINTILDALRAVARPVLRELPLWLTMVFSFIPMTWAALEFHLIKHHDLELLPMLGSLVTDASVAVNKIIKYVTQADYGNWKNSMLNVADDGDNSNHH